MKKKQSLQPYLHFNMDVSCGHQNSVFKWTRIITWNIALYLFPFSSPLLPFPLYSQPSAAVVSIHSSLIVC